ncbi:hypothetical protein [Sulfurovum sp. NBC37-1]|uniref:hypothetical protein n=1 Tax=Sulfurovum sp. (strain NBC37-1) TaxID=387093 RepID=UPI00015878CC|nr:hypothetical protein [Sulfurovum sp. NBC37-1]BAF72021.1 conserved hypothetical protein [Sulfurovum sp. NBC37-1]
MKTMIQLFFLFLILPVSVFSQESGYKLGHGIKVGDLPLYMGGYFSLEYEDLSHTAGRSLKLDDISVMLYGEHENIAYMMEFEASDIYTESFGGPEASEEVNDHFHIERMYLDYTFNEHTMARMGKFNSPIGLWNLISINVLRDTTSNPVISEILFPRFTTGVELKYSSNNDSMLTVDVLVQGTEDMDALISDEVYNNLDTDRHYGAGLSAEGDAWNYHLNAGYFRLVSDKSYFYFSAAVQYFHEKFKLQGEVGTQFDDEGTTVPYVGYVQGLYTLKEGHEAIFRVESYDDRDTDRQDTFAVFAYTYRPLYSVAIKGEYQWHSFSEDNKFMLSFSMLF